MEDASLDAGRLTRGRTYARKGVVGAIVVEPGRFHARVQGSREEPYEVEVLIDELTDAEWDAVPRHRGRAGRAHRRAARPRDAARPGRGRDGRRRARCCPALGDLEPDCACPDDGHPCKHAAALCYQASRLLDDDPFVLLLMRGRGERELVAELQRRNVSAAAVAEPARGAPAASPVDAAAAFAAGVPPLPEPPPPPDGPAPLEVPAGAGVDAAVLRLLAADAASRARATLAAAPEPAGGDVRVLDAWEDAVRMAATHRDAVLWARLGDGAGERFDRAVWAWTFAGVAGIDALGEVWSPAAAEVARGRAALAAAFDDDDVPEVSVWRNRFTVAGREVQVRLGRDGRWYPYRRRAGDWWPAGPPARDPGAALGELLAPA